MIAVGIDDAVLLDQHAAAAALTPSVLDTDRSISPVMMISVIGSAIIRIGRVLLEEVVRRQRAVEELDVDQRVDVDDHQRRDHGGLAVDAAGAGRCCASTTGSRGGWSWARPCWWPCSSLASMSWWVRRRVSTRSRTIDADDQAADHGALPEVADAEDRQRPVDGDEQEGADGGAPHGAAAAEDRDAADHHGGDRLQLEVAAGAGEGGGVAGDGEDARPDRPAPRTARRRRTRACRRCRP